MHRALKYHWAEKIMSRARLFARDNSGAAAIEFALVGPLFFLMIFGIFEVTINYTADRVLDAGIEKVARDIRTGNVRVRPVIYGPDADGDGNPDVIDPGYGEAEFRDAVCNDALISILFRCDDLMLDVQRVTAYTSTPVPVKPDGSVNDAAFDFNPGGPCELTVIRAFYEWPTVLSDWDKFFTWSASPSGGLEKNHVTAFENNSRLIGTASGFRNECFT